ncbi:MAG: EamA family transporter [Phycisphaerae bacterium]|jgi:drug/metabolite transporter (DMT)-like permease
MKELVAPKQWLVIAAFAAVYLVWGSTYLAIRFAVETLPPFLMAGVRFLVAGAVLYGWVCWRQSARPTFTHWRSAIIIGALLLLCGYGGVAWAEQYLASSVAVLLIGSVPVWLVLSNWVRRDGVAPGVLEVGGIALGLAGVLLLVAGGNGSGGEPMHRLGALVVLFSSLAWAIGSIYSRHAPLPKSALLATSMEMLAGAGWLIVAGIVCGEPARIDPGGISVLSLVSLAYLIVFGSLIGFTAYIWLLQVSTPAKVSTYAFVNPVVAVILGCTLGGEPFTWRILAATAVIIGGVVLITLHRAKVTQAPCPIEPCGEREARTESLGERCDPRLAGRRVVNAPVTEARPCGEPVGVCE